MVQIIGEAVEDMVGNSEAIPEPIAGKTYSGKFQVRISAEQHRNLVIQAAEQGFTAISHFFKRQDSLLIRIHQAGVL